MGDAERLPGKTFRRAGLLNLTAIKIQGFKLADLPAGIEAAADSPGLSCTVVTPDHGCSLPHFAAGAVSFEIIKKTLSAAAPGNIGLFPEHL
jgi:hypothetical protein